MESSDNPRIRTAVFTPLTIGLLLSACMTAQSAPQTVLDAGHVVMLKVVVLKKERRLELLGQGSVIRIYKVALGGARRAQDQTRRPQDAGGHAGSGFPQSSQPVLQVNPRLVSERA